MELAGPGIQLVQWMSAPISSCWKYHGGLKENMGRLQQKMEDLNCRKRDILSRLDTEVVQGETKSKYEVQLWLQRVEKIGDEINTINEKVETVKCFSRAGIGKNVIQKIDEVEELYRNGVFPDGLLLQLRQQIGEIQPTTTLGGETTSKRKMEEIWALLMGNEVRKIGVFGMGGIGKTTVMKHINNRLLEEKKKFDGVIWVTASKASSIKKLQDAIARQINLDISKYDDESERASKLYAKLSKTERHVLILDDLWGVYRLDEVGIPEPTSQNGSKFLLTTRLLNVCRGMSCKAIPMERLSKMEALNLFLDTVGRDVLSDPNMEAIVNSVVKECARLPLAIVTIAGSLKGIVDYNDWKMALEDLKTYTKGTNEIFEKLKFSYDRLHDKNLQVCLLYCALFPEDYAIERDKLIEYLVAEEIIKERNMQTALARGQAMLNKLINACLLEETKAFSRGKCVKMHDLIRDMALQITTDCPRFLVEAGMGLECVPDEDNWKKDLVRVSLMQNTISNIPSSFDSPKCPTLSTLLLNANPLRSISNNFFLHMKGLSVLDLSDSSIKNIPESISDLVNLTALLLQRCYNLAYVPSLAKLTALKKLDFWASQMKQVPQGIGNLSELRYLRFGRCNFGIMPDGILCKLSKLQYLSLSPRSVVKIKGEELVHLRKLESLYCALHDVEGFNAYVRSLAEEGPRPTNYLLQLGRAAFNEDVQNTIECKVVNLHRFEDIKASVAAGGDFPLLLPQDVEILLIRQSCINSSSSCGLASFENVMNLRQCSLNNCVGLKHSFLYSSSIIRLLQKLEKLFLDRVRDLQGLIRRESIASSPLPPGTFSSLKILAVWHCSNLKRLFINAPLPNLEEISVKSCRLLVEIISTTSNPNEEGEEEDQDEEAVGSDCQAIVVTLPKLWTLKLFSLPKLKSIPVVADRSLRQVCIGACPKLKRVPCLDREPFPASLQSVYLDKDLWDSLEWDHPNAKHAARNR